MGLDSEIVCVGPYKKELSYCMDYPDDFKNDGPPDGTIVSTIILHCNTTSLSRELAKCVGVDIDDFSTYQIDYKKVKWLSIGMINNSEWEKEDYTKEIAEWRQLEILLRHGFTCVFRPNY